MAAGEIAQRFLLLSSYQVYRPGSIRARLVNLLNEYLDRKRVPRSRKNRAQISRTHFANLLGVAPSRMTQLRNILGAYEAVLESIEPLSELPKFGLEAFGPLDDAAWQVVSVYPAVLKHQHYPYDSTDKKVVRALNDQIVSGGLIRSRGGKISRKSISTKLGLSPSAMTACLKIIEEYEVAAGGERPAIEAMIPVMRTWFEKKMLEGGSKPGTERSAGFSFSKNSVCPARIQC